MASKQNQADSHQRPSSPTSRIASPDFNRRRSRAPSVVSEDSQVVLLHDPHNSHHSSPQISDPHKARISSSTPSSIASEPRKCWICLATEVEDTPTSSAWRTPCPCALTAHERCLLDWVAQLEDPHHSRRTIECPQCKAKITIVRPRSYLAESILALESAGGRLVIPILLVTVAGGVLAGCWVHGCATILLIFGFKDGDPFLGFAANGTVSTADLFLPLIPVLLIASRTTMFDNLFRALPIVFLYSHISTWSVSRLWPPTPAITFLALPYVRSTYNAFYDYFFAPRKKAWLKELEPRGGDHGEGPANENNPPPEEQGEEPAHGHVFEIGLEIQLMAGDDAPDQPLPVEMPPAQQQNAENPPAAPVQAAPRERPQLDLVATSMGLADKIVGALLFPALSAAMGELLKLALPYTWRTLPRMWERRSAGLLQTRWGRSVVGGCLVVLLKDSMVLYSRYHLAQTQRKRTVLDWPGKGKRSAGA